MVKKRKSVEKIKLLEGTSESEICEFFKILAKTLNKEYDPPFVSEEFATLGTRPLEGGGCELHMRFGQRDVWITSKLKTHKTRKGEVISMDAGTDMTFDTVIVPRPPFTDRVPRPQIDPEDRSDGVQKKKKRKLRTISPKMKRFPRA